MYHNNLNKIWLATGNDPVYLEPSMANRHGLIAGDTGTGKTVTLKVLAESFSDMGVPTFIADIKGDLSGMAEPGCENKYILRSIETMGITDFKYTSYPVRFWDVYGKKDCLSGQLFQKWDRSSFQGFLDLMILSQAFCE